MKPDAGAYAKVTLKAARARSQTPFFELTRKQILRLLVIRATAI